MSTFLVYFYTQAGDTHYDYFTRLSGAFLQGRLYLTENPSWLNELIPIDGRYYVVYPPMPAIVAMPTTFIFGNNISQTLLSILLGSFNVCLVYLLCKKLQFSQKTSWVVTLFFAYGTPHWYLANVGSAWYIAHIVAVLFLLLALLETFGKGRLFLIGLLVGASFWARSPVIFASAFFYIYFWRKFYPLNKKNLKNFLLLSLGVGIFIVLDAWYNFARFGTPSIFSPYELIPGIENDPIFPEGFMSLNYIPRHLEALFWKLPTLQSNWPYFIPSIISLPIWFTSPLLVLIFNFKKKLLTASSWAAIIPTFFIVSMWGGIGFTQFGYRFLLDYLVFLLILLGLGIGKKPNWFVYILLLISIIVNFWGIILINKYNISIL